MMVTSSIQRKCPQCNTWNTEGEINCKSCGTTLDVSTKLKEDHEAGERKRIALPKTKFDHFVDRIAKSNNPFIKVAYVFIKTVWFIYWVILSIFLWMVAATPG